MAKKPYLIREADTKRICGVVMAHNRADLFNELDAYTTPYSFEFRILRSGFIIHHPNEPGQPEVVTIGGTTKVIEPAPPRADLRFTNDDISFAEDEFTKRECKLQDRYEDEHGDDPADPSVNMEWQAFTQEDFKRYYEALCEPGVEGREAPASPVPAEHHASIH